MIFLQLPNTTANQIGEWFLILVAAAIGINVIWSLITKIRGNPVKREEFQSLESRVHIVEVNQSTAEKLDRKMDQIMDAINRKRRND